MGLPKIIQIPCHHVLANQNSLIFKKGAPLKQFFNINLGIGIIKKLPFLFAFLTYLFLFLLKFRPGELPGCEIKFCIQRVPTRHTFDGPYYPKNKKYLKKCDDDTHWMQDLIMHPTSSPGRNLSKNTGRYVENTKKSSFCLFSLQN